MFKKIIFIFTFSMLFSFQSFAIDCAKEYQERLDNDLDLSYKEFDQTDNKGMRVLANMGCHKEAADLTEAYIKKNDSKENSLRWHIAQHHAMANNYSAAILSAKQSLVENEDFSKRPLRWNNYVLATIAFLERDRSELLLHRNLVAKGENEYFGNKLNLKLLDVLIDNFDLSYGEATSKL